MSELFEENNIGTKTKQTKTQKNPPTHKHVMDSPEEVA